MLEVEASLEDRHEKAGDLGVGDELPVRSSLDDGANTLELFDRAFTAHDLVQDVEVVRAQLLDHRLGRHMNADMAGYHVPVNADVHGIEVIFDVIEKTKKKDL